MRGVMPADMGSRAYKRTVSMSWFRRLRGGGADQAVPASPLYFWTISSKLKAFIEGFYCIAEEYSDPPYGVYERYPVKDSALLMTSADEFFWTFEQAVSYYQFAVVNDIGFHDRGMLLAGGCGDTNGKPQIDKTGYLQKAYEFGKNIYKK